jgi:predicted flap endonuclease-1-like 5' DNA nuclease
MNRLSTTKWTAVLFILICALLFNTATAQDKPLLSEAIRKAIDGKGIEVAKKQFSEMNQSQREKYNIDMQGISKLTNAYVQAGNMEAAGAVSEISAPFLQDMITKSMNQYSPEMSEKMKEQQQAEKEQKAKAREEKREHQEQEQIVNFQGQPRDDLKRFTGLYGDPSDPNRNLWVTVSCDGYLVSGAMWGDVAPWWMKSVGDNVFTYQDSFSKLKMEFETDANGKAVSMKHDLEHLKSPLKRLGPLPDDFDPCMERPKR